MDSSSFFALIVASSKIVNTICFARDVRHDRIPIDGVFQHTWKCEEVEGVQGVLTLFCSGAAQVCHDDRIVELKEQEEEDGDRQEEKVEEKGEVESRRVRHG